MDGEGFYISYNPDTQLSALANPFGAVQQLGEMIGLEHSGAETALVKEHCSKTCPVHFYILNGDFREQYKKLLPKGFEECLKFYETQKGEHGSNWTTEHR